jgi:hypothetical protein
MLLLKLLYPILSLIIVCFIMKNRHNLPNQIQCRDSLCFVQPKMNKRFTLDLLLLPNASCCTERGITVSVCDFRSPDFNEIRFCKKGKKTSLLVRHANRVLDHH